MGAKTTTSTYTQLTCLTPRVRVITTKQSLVLPQYTVNEDIFCDVHLGNSDIYILIIKNTLRNNKKTHHLTIEPFS